MKRIDLSKWKKWLWPNNWGRWRYLLPYVKTYHEPARFHDVWYELALIPRKQIDDKFYILMKKKKKSVFATIYYKLVRKYWENYYTKNNFTH